MIKKLKILFRGHMSLVILTVKKLLERFTKKKSKRFRVEKVTKRKDDKLDVKWKGCNNYFNSWIDRSV